MPEDQRAALVERLRGRLLAEARQEGWGYYTGRTPRVEPTSWALLALGENWVGPESWVEFARPRFAFLGSRQTPSGLLSDTDPSLASLAANGLAALVSARHADALPSAELRRRIYEGVVALKGVRLDEVDPRQNNQLQAWPWVQDTFSWIEPTAWCLTALKRLPATARGEAVAARMAQAEAVLENRMCVGGGWNYGNASAVGQDLRAYVPTTAVGVMALHDRRGTPVVEQSLQRLIADRLTEPGTPSLALTRIALALHDRPADDVDALLMERVQTSEHDGHLQALAMALFALTVPMHRAEALRAAV